MVGVVVELGMEGRGELGVDGRGGVVGMGGE